MKLNYFLLITFFHFNVACSQQKNEKKEILSQTRDTVIKSSNLKYSPIDFSSRENMASGLTGECSFKYEVEINKTNLLGNAQVYMFYSKGENAWKIENSKRFSNDSLFGVNRGVETAKKRLLQQDREKLKQFDYFAFFINKKYLEKNVADNNKEYFRVKSNINLEIILYQKLEGEENWLEIAKKEFKSDEYGGYDTSWIENFITIKREKYK